MTDVILQSAGWPWKLPRHSCTSSAARRDDACWRWRNSTAARVGVVGVGAWVRGGVGGAWPCLVDACCVLCVPSATLPTRHSTPRHRTCPPLRNCAIDAASDGFSATMSTLTPMAAAWRGAAAVG